MTPWALINEAGALSAGSQRTELLATALEQLSSIQRDVLEARGVILALQALDEPALLAAAVQAFDEAADSGADVSFVGAHLAEALLQAGRYPEIARAVSLVDRERFAEAGLHWRNVRIDQIAATALVRSRQLTLSKATVARVLNAMASEGDLEFLPPPTELVEALLDATQHQEPALRQTARSLLQNADDAVRLEEWLPPATLNRFREMFPRP